MQPVHKTYQALFRVNKHILVIPAQSCSSFIRASNWARTSWCESLSVLTSTLQPLMPQSKSIFRIIGLTLSCSCGNRRTVTSLYCPVTGFIQVVLILNKFSFALRAAPFSADERSFAHRCPNPMNDFPSPIATKALNRYCPDPMGIVFNGRVDKAYPTK